MNTSDDVSQSTLDPGVYLNMFEVLVGPFVTRLHTAPRSRLPDLRDLRKACEANGQDVHVHAVDSVVYGYGTDRTVLEAHGFVESTIEPLTHPKLVAHLIEEGYASCLREAQYSVDFDYGRIIAYQTAQPLQTLAGGERLIRGLEIQTLFLHDPDEDRVRYFIVVDAVFAYRDKAGEPLSPRQLNEVAGEQALTAFRVRQGDLTPDKAINQEVARHRVTRFILPFIRTRSLFSLPPDDTEARVSTRPIRVVMSLAR